MTNEDIIWDEIDRLASEGKMRRDEILLTQSEWAKRGYRVRENASPITTVKLWIQHTGKNDRKFLIQRPTNLYASFQVEKIAP